MVTTRLNLGCGPVQPQGWINVDGSLRCWMASHLPLVDRLLVKLKLWPLTEFNDTTTYANLLKRLPWPDNSVDCVYMGEVLEHFTKEDGAKLLKECRRVLRPGGILRCRVPDNVRFWRSYLEEFDRIYAKPKHEWTQNHSRWIDMFFRDICVKPSRTKSFGHYHKFMYDEVSLTLTLLVAGFVSPERKGYLQSNIPGVDAVETHEDLTVEAVKQ